MKYANLNGNSDVLSFEIGSDYIDATFGDYSTYRYSYSSAGIFNVEEMKRLAYRGYGLNGYIMRNCKYDYERSF